VSVIVVGMVFAQSGPPNGRSAATEQTTILNAIRQYALSYTGSLPNYTCAEVIRRSMTPAMTIKPHLQTDIIEEQLSFIAHREIHKVTRVNGTAVANLDPSQVPGTYSRGEFGNLLDQIFEPQTETSFAWDRTTKLNGHRTNVFAFRVPQARGYGLVEARRTIIAAYRGFVYADELSNAVMRIQMHCIDLPDDSDFKSVELTLDYKPTRVAGQEFILPSHYLLRARKVDGDLLNEADYKSYRRFGSNATIEFDDGAR
jgi:hypothetical protein